MSNQTDGAVGGWPDLVMAKDEARVWYESTVSVEEKVRNPLALHLNSWLSLCFCSTSGANVYKHL
jgi:hypothetical protein